MQSLAGGSDQRPCRRFDIAVRFQPRAGRARIAPTVNFIARPLQLSSTLYPLAHRRGPGASVARGQARKRNGRNGHVQIDAICEWSGQASAVLHDIGRGAHTRLARSNQRHRRDAARHDISRDGKFLYVLQTGTGTIGTFTSPITADEARIVEPFSLSSCMVGPMQR